jgi:hypothetical protein
LKKAIALLFFVLASHLGFSQVSISNVYVSSSTATTATIVWTTNVGATSQIKYGFDSSIPFSNNADPTLVTSHSMTLILLNPAQPYYFAVVSGNGSSTATSSTAQFSLCGDPLVEVSGTINLLYGNGTYTFTWNPPAGGVASPTVCGQPVATTVTGKLNGFGSFNTSVADSLKVRPGPGTWTVVDTDPGNLSPVTITLPIFSKTQDISAQLQQAALSAGLVGVIANINNNTVYPAFLTPGGSVSGQASGFIPVGCTASSICAQSHLDDGVTNAGMITATEPIVLSSDVPIGHQAASANAAVLTYSVLAYGAKADMIQQDSSGNFITGSMTASGTTMTLFHATCTTVTDVGKYISVYAWNFQPFATVTYVPGSLTWTPSNVAQITACPTTGTATLSKPAVNTFNGFLEIGTDNTPAFAAAVTAAKRTLTTNSGIVDVPAGPYMFATAPYYLNLGAFDNGSPGDTTVGGSGATGTCSVSGGQVTGCTPVSGGSNYVVSAKILVNFSGGCPTGAAYSICLEPYGYATTNSSGQVASFTITEPGFGLTSGPTPSIPAFPGTGGAATATISGGAINTLTVTAVGSGYAPSSSAGSWNAVGGGCAVLGGLSAGAQPQVAKGSFSTDASGHVTTMAITTNATGCTSPPTIIFGLSACNTGTIASPVWVQCTLLDPLLPTPTPVSIYIPQSVGIQGHSTKGGNGSSLYGVWDGITVDNNQTALMGSTFAHTDVKNLSFWSSMFNIVADNNVNYASFTDLSFSGGIGMMTNATDLYASFTNLSFSGYATWVNGGSWRSRADFTAGLGGFFDATSVTNVISRPIAYGSMSNNLDDWFANNVWHPEFSGASTDYVQTCSFPQTLNQRQTAHNQPQTANNMCYEGITSWGLVILTHDGRTTGGPQMTNFLTKQTKRGIFYGSLGVTKALGWSCEACGGLVTDPYRPSSASVLEGAVVFDDQGADLTTVGWSGTNPGICLFSIPAEGQPTNSSWNLQGSSCPANVTIPIQNPNQQNQWAMPYGIAVGGGGGVSGKGIDYNYLSGGSTFLGGRIVGNFGLQFIGQDGTTDVADWSTSGSSVKTAFTANLNFKLLSGGTAMTGNQGTGTLLQHSTGTIASGNFIKADASGNTVDSGIAATTPVADQNISIGSFAIPANTCFGSTGSTTPATVTMTGLTTSMLVSPGFTANASAITGWGTAGGLSLMAWPSSANTASYLVCNATSGSITGGAITLVLGAK